MNLRDALRNQRVTGAPYAFTWGQDYWQNPEDVYRYLSSRYDSAYKFSTTLKPGVTSINPGRETTLIGADNLRVVKFVNEWLAGNIASVPLSDYLVYTLLSVTGSAINSSLTLSAKASQYYPLLMFHVVEHYVNFYTEKLSESITIYPGHTQTAETPYSLFTFVYDSETGALSDITPTGNVMDHTEVFTMTNTTRIRLKSWPVHSVSITNGTSTSNVPFFGFYEIAPTASTVTVSYKTCPGIIYMPQDVDNIVYSADISDVDNNYIKLLDGI